MIEAFISGTSVREIARWTNPPVAHNSISRFMRARVTPALSNATKLLSVDPPRTGTVSANGAPTRARQQAEHRQVDRHQVEQLAAQAVVAAPVLSLFRQRLEKLQGRVDRALDRAENAVRVVERDGNLAAAGPDLSALAPLLNVAHKNLEMLGRATGELDPSAGSQIALQIICPSTGSAPGEMPRISFARVDQIEAAADDDEAIMEIGITQLEG